jgi:hypothetical protein
VSLIAYGRDAEPTVVFDLGGVLVPSTGVLPLLAAAVRAAPWSGRVDRLVLHDRHPTPPWRPSGWRSGPPGTADHIAAIRATAGHSDRLNRMVI